MDYVLDNPLTHLQRCPQCGTARPTMHLHRVIFTRSYAYGSRLGWAIYQCSSCDDVVCFKGGFPEPDDNASAEDYFSFRDQHADTMLPRNEDDFSDWPERAKRYMKQATEAIGTPDGAVMLAGSAVDAMLKEKGLANGSVYKRIQDAVQSNLLTEAMGEWAHSVRLAANSPRHADLDEPHASRDEAKASIEFARALGQFLFVLPARIERGKEAAKRASGQSDDTP